MRVQQIFALIAANILFCAPISAIQFDKSCSGRQLDILTEAFDCSFDKAQLAVDLIRNPLTGPLASQGQNINDLKTTLFGDTAGRGQTAWTPDQWVKARFAGDTAGTPPPRGWSPGENRQYTGVLSVRNVVGQDQPLAENDVKIFCSTDRFSRKKNKDNNGQTRWQWFDADQNAFLEDDVEEPDPTAACHTFNDGISINMNMAITENPAPRANEPSYYNTITVCPWFLQYMQKSNFPSCKRFQDYVKGLIAKWQIDRVSAQNGYTEIDQFSLPDKVMLHELTHTTAGGQTLDVLLDAGRDKDDMANKAYGWNNARTIVDRVSINGPAYNADTFALFAHGVSIINAGGSVDRDTGTLTNAPDPNTGPRAPGKRRDTANGTVEAENATSVWVV